MPNPIKPNFKTEVIPVIIIIITTIASFYFYSRFPERVPTHWDFAGNVNGYSSRTVGAFLVPGMLVGMYLLFLAIPYIDPKKERYAQFRKVYHFFKAFLILFMAIIYFIASLNAMGYNIPVGSWVPLLVGVMFVGLGNYMGKIKPNWFMGIRTPWTLSSEEVWNKTHRFGGKVFMLGGVIMAVIGALPTGWQGPLFAADMVIILAGTVGYSYFAYLKENKKKTNGNDHEQR